MSSDAKAIPLEKLNIEQLTYIGKQLEQEINSYSSYYTSLRVAETKFADNKDYIVDLKTYQDKEILVPMTSSLYIPGKCSDVKKVTIEIGGNFLVETTIDKADKYCDRKLEAVKQSMNKIDEIIKNKSDQLNAINKFIIEKQTAPKK
jgi:prefoldin alpha subunit